MILQQDNAMEYKQGICDEIQAAQMEHLGAAAQQITEHSTGNLCLP